MYSTSKQLISVIIPTYNRVETLKLCLEHLEQQTYSTFEVIIVDDGSTDTTSGMLDAYEQHSKLYFKRLHQPNGGPAKGRNLAIQAATSEVCILIGDDILVSPSFVQTHLELHQTQPEESIVGLGLTQWDNQYQSITSFMKWLEKIQFAYGDLLAGKTPDWRYFYTSNLSFKTNLLRTWSFDERFKRAAFEDIELGYRLTDAGLLNMVFLSNAIATHVHPTTLADACRRMRSVGFSQRQFLSYWPNSAQVPPTTNRLKHSLYRFLARRQQLLETLTSFASNSFVETHPGKLASCLLMSHHQVGYMEYEAEQ